jgi:hypothetical protein
VGAVSVVVFARVILMADILIWGGSWLAVVDLIAHFCELNALPSIPKAVKL